MVTQERQADAFTRIDASAGIGVTVTIGTQRSIVVAAQENLQPVIATTVEQDVLRIRSTQGYSSAQPVEVRVVIPSLDGVTLRGGSPATIAGLSAERVEFDVSGGAGVTATGTADDVVVSSSGGARASLEGLGARTVTVDASGGSTVTVNASEAVTGSASGGASVNVLGDAQVDVDSSGGASVNRR